LSNNECISPTHFTWYMDTINWVINCELKHVQMAISRSISSCDLLMVTQLSSVPLKSMVNLTHVIVQYLWFLMIRFFLWIMQFWHMHMIDHAKTLRHTSFGPNILLVGGVTAVYI
jgi:hypothetical protein